MFKRLSIRYKIGLIAFIGFLGFATYQFAIYRLSVDVRDQLQSILSDDFAVLKFANKTQIYFSDLDKGYQASLAEADLDLLHEVDAEAMTARLKFELIRNQYRDGLDANFDELMTTFEAYVELISGHTAAVIADTLNYEDTLSGYAQVNLLRERYNELQQEFVDERYRSFEDQLIAIEQAEEAMVEFGFFLGLLISILLVFITLLLSRRLIITFSNAVAVAEQIANGNLDKKIEIDSEDETGKLLHSLAALRDVLKKQNQENLVRAKTQNFMADLNELLRGDRSVEELANLTLGYLAKKMQAQHGAIYIYQLAELRLLAEYARPSRGGLPETLGLGETLIGQVAKDLEAKVVKNVPSELIYIETGVGDLAPCTMLLVPILFENELKAVVELTGFQEFTEEELNLVLRCNDAIAIAVNSAQVRLEASEMLRKTKEQAQELQLQRQELALFNQQLAEQTHDLDRQKNQVLEKNRELEQSRKELLEKTQALELSGRYKSQFLSTMSHELRTPLNSILILSESLMENRKATLDDKDIQHAKVIYNAGGDLLALINDILDLSKVEEGKMDLVIDEISTRGFADSIKQQFEYQCKEKGLNYQVILAEDVPQTFYTDKHRLKQIVKNFISNAIKFTDTGSVSVEIGRVKPNSDDKLHNAQEQLFIRVKDTGIGIDEAKQAIVFEAFKQADGTTSRKYGGTGLGLTISRELAHLLGGEVYLQSPGLGQGATFSLLLPVGEASALLTGGEVQHKEAEKSTLTLTGKEKLLLIEDNPVLHMVMQSTFKQFGIVLDIAETGSEAIKAVTQQDYDAVICDLNLPDWGGVQLLEKLRAEHIAADKPILVFTAEDVSYDRKQSIMRYANGIASKDPKAMLELPARIADLLYGAISESPSYRDDLAGRTILLVDDDARNLYSICAVLEAEQLNVVTARSGAEALALLSALPEIELVLLDIMMPEMDGYEVLNRIRQGQYADIPVIALTAKAMVGDKERCLQEGASDYLAKPVKPQVLLATMAQFFK